MIQSFKILLAMLLLLSASPEQQPAAPVDVTTLTGKVMCGYQGWFNCDGDGAQRGWVHWTKGKGPLAPGNARIDLLPDVSELGGPKCQAPFGVFLGPPISRFGSSRQATTKLNQ